jgi:hypothetical protein
MATIGGRFLDLLRRFATRPQFLVASGVGLIQRTLRMDAVA